MYFQTNRYHGKLPSENSYLLPVQHFYFSSTGVTTLPFGNIMQTLKLFAKKPELNTDPFQIIPKLPDQKPYPQLSAKEIEILSNRQAYRQKWSLLPEPPSYKQMYSGSKATTNLFHNKHIKNRYGNLVFTIYLLLYYYRPPTKLGEGDVFTGMCLSRGGGYPWSQVLSVR